MRGRPSAPEPDHVARTLPAASGDGPAVTFVLLAVAVALADAPVTEADRALTLHDVRAAALVRAPAVLSSRRRVDGAQADVETAGAWPNPTVNVSTASITARLAASVAQPLPFGRTGPAVAAGRADLEAARQDVAAVTLDARRDATVAWVDLWEAQEKVRLQALAVADAEQLLGLARDKADNGTGAKLDVVRATAERATAAAAAASARASVLSAAARLAPLLGRDPAQPLATAGAPVFKPVPDVAILDAAVAAHPRATKEAASLEAAEARGRLERAQRWPALEAQFGASALDPTQPGTDVTVGLALELPIFDRRVGHVARAGAEVELQRLALEAATVALRSELHDAWRRAQGAREALATYDADVLPALAEAEQMTTDGFALGRLDALPVVLARAAVRDARLARSAAVAEFTRAMADLEHATGLELLGTEH